MASKYKVTVTYDDGHTKDINFSIPAFPGTYQLTLREECEVSDMYPNGYRTYAPLDIVVGKEQKQYKLGFRLRNGADAPIETYSGIIKTPSLALADLTWNEVAAISEAGLASQYFNIGDKKALPNSAYTAVIVGFDHDDLADGSGKAGITFAIDTRLSISDVKSLIPTVSNPCYMNSTATNVGGWGSSKMLNETMWQLERSLFKAFNRIKSVNKPYYTYDAQLNKTSLTAVSKLFLFSMQEVSTNPIAAVFEGEGAVYEYWKNNNCFGWLRTVYPSGTSSFVYRNADTLSFVGSTANTAHNIQPGFCI